MGCKSLMGLLLWRMGRLGLTCSRSKGKGKKVFLAEGEFPWSLTFTRVIYESKLFFAGRIERTKCPIRCFRAPFR